MCNQTLHMEDGMEYGSIEREIHVDASPEIVYEVVRPLVSLLHLNCSGLQNFEALMALTNLAGISERLR